MSLRVIGQLVTGAGLVSLAACGGAAPAIAQQVPQVQATATPSPQAMTDAALKMAEGLTPVANTQAVAPVPFEALVELIPDADGWTRNTPRGENVTVGMQIARADARYERGDSNMRLEITDSGLNELLLKPLSAFLVDTFSERTNRGYKKAARINGHPGVEMWEEGTRRADVTTVVNNRFIVHGWGNDVESAAVVRLLVEAVDFTKLAGLK